MAVLASKWLPLLFVELLIAGAGLLYVFTFQPSCSSQSASSSAGFPIDLGLNYGNSTTSDWRSMQVPVCATLYDTMQLAGWRMNTKSYGSLGVFIIGINGVEQSGGAYWQWYGWRPNQWNLGPVGASSYMIQSGDMILWYYGSSAPSGSLSPRSPFTVMY